MGFRDHPGVGIAHNCASVLRRHYILSVAVVIACCLAVIQFYPSKDPSGTSSKWTGTPPYTYTGPTKYKFNGTWDFRRDEKNYHLDDVECQEAFPGLFDEVDRAVEDRRDRTITFEEVESIPRINGYVRGMIYDQEVGFSLFTLYPTQNTEREDYPQYRTSSSSLDNSLHWRNLLTFMLSLCSSTS